MADAPTCSASSLAAGEPLAGSAVSETRFWLGIEVRAPWEAKAVEKAEFSPPIRAILDRFAGLDGTRIQLLRRPGRTGPLRVVLADTTPGAERRHAFDLDAHDDLAAIDLDGLIAGTGGGITTPEVWVCTHAQRDACCGLHGGKLFAALRERLGDAVWQTSHLGGHRFAATLLWLPHGLSYGRLRAEEAPALLAAAERGEVHDPQRLRGRCAWPEPVQAAEVGLRRATGWSSLDAPRLLGFETEGAEVAVRFDVGREVVVRVREEAVPEPVIPSCGKPAAPARGWQVIAAA